MPLTLDRAKPAVPFGGSYRLIDFALSNLVNAGYPAALRADAVQVALARPAHLGDLADVDAARQLRDPGAGAAAARQAVVPRQRRRDLPVDEPHRTTSGPTSSWCSAPTTSTGWTPRRWSQAHIESGAGVDGRGHPGAAQGGLPVRRDQDRRRRRHDRRVPREAGRPARPGRQPGRVVRVDGQLRLHRRRAGRGAGAATPPTRRPATTWAATSSRCSSTQSEAAVYDFKRNDVPGSTAKRPRLLARRRDARRRTTRRTSTWSPSSRPSTSTTTTGRSSPRTRSCPARSSSRTRRPTTRSCAPGSIVSGATVDSRCSATTSTSPTGAPVERSVHHGQRADRPGRGHPQRDHRQERRRPRRRRSASTTRRTGGAGFTVTEGGVVALGKDQLVIP